MPVRIGSDKDGCFARWGSKGKKYRYKCGDAEGRKEAEALAHQQGIAIEYSATELALAYAGKMRVSFDYDGTLTQERIQEIAKRLVKEGDAVYVISARNDKSGMLELAKSVGIPEDWVFATGSNRDKLIKIRALNIDLHWDDNKDVVRALGIKGRQA